MNASGEAAPSLWQRLTRRFRGAPQTTEDVVAMVEEASENEVIDNDARRIISGALEVAEMHAREVMIPRTQMVVLKLEDSPAANIQKIIESAHSRYPVVGENMDQVLGILLAKDILPRLYEQLQLAQQDSDDAKAAFDAGEPDGWNLAEKHGGSAFLEELIRPPVVVPESKRLNILLKQFREDRNHMALVIDEYGSLAGLITIEDVLEEIVGEIEDEHDLDDNALIRKMSGNNYIVNALTPIEEFNEAFGCEFDDDEFDTIGGIIINHFGRLPERDDTVTLNGFEFHVMRADSRRLHTLRMSIQPDTAAELAVEQRAS